MTDFKFRSHDGKFGLQLAQKHVDKILGLCKAAGSLETGGVLVGKYNERHDVAFVTRIVAAPPDSQSGPAWFQRGVDGVKRKLVQDWVECGSYYLGEWHFHPYADPTPSYVDRKQMCSWRFRRAFRCPEPLLLIVGNPHGAWQARAFVYPTEDYELELVAARGNASLGVSAT